MDKNYFNNKLKELKDEILNEIKTLLNSSLLQEKLNILTEQSIEWDYDRSAMLVVDVNDYCSIVFHAKKRSADTNLFFYVKTGGAEAFFGYNDNCVFHMHLRNTGHEFGIRHMRFDDSGTNSIIRKIHAFQKALFSKSYESTFGELLVYP